MDADAPDWKNLYCGSCTLQVSGWLSLLSPVGRPHTHTHSNTHTHYFHLLITQMQPIYLSWKILFICLEAHKEVRGECVSSSWVTLEFLLFR